MTDAALPRLRHGRAEDLVRLSGLAAADIGRQVTLFVARAPGLGETEFRAAGDGDIRAFWWVEGDLGCALVGDLPAVTLRDLSVVAYHGLTEA